MKSIHYLVVLLAIAILWSGCDKESALEKARQWDVSGITPIKDSVSIAPYSKPKKYDVYDVYILEEGDGNVPLHQQEVCYEVNIFLESNGSAVFTTIESGPQCSYLGDRKIPLFGLDHGILKMSYGAKYRCVFPPELGYGYEINNSTYAMAFVPPGSTIYVDVELTSQH